MMADMKGEPNLVFATSDQIIGRTCAHLEFPVHPVVEAAAD